MKIEYYCEKCGFINDFDIKKEIRTYEINGKEITAEVDVKVCKTCGDELSGDGLIDEESKIFRDEYRRQNGLLTSGEIKQIRRKLNLNQVEFSQFLGMGDKTIARYENGQIQDVAHDNLMRAALLHEFINTILATRKLSFTITTKLKRYLTVSWKLYFTNYSTNNKEIDYDANVVA